MKTNYVLESKVKGQDQIFHFVINPQRFDRFCQKLQHIITIKKLILKINNLTLAPKVKIKGQIIPFSINPNRLDQFCKKNVPYN